MKTLNMLAIAAVLAALAARLTHAQPLVPELIDISPGNPWPLSPVGMPKAPFTVRFTPVEGANNYSILLSGPGQFNLTLNTFALGDFVEASFVLPPQANAGFYQLRIQALNQNGVPMGAASPPFPFPTITQQPVSFVPNFNTVADGVMLVSQVHVPPHVTVTVPNNLVLYSIGSVDVLGAIVGSAGQFSGESGAGVTINAAGPMQISGFVLGGDGADGQNVVTSANSGQQAVAAAGDAGHGGAVALRTLNASITILSSAHVESGLGGNGGNATAIGGNANQPLQRGGDATAIGGAGGNGGDLTVYSQSLLPDSLFVAQIPGILVSNNGGRGGHVRAKGGNGGPGLPDVEGGFGAFGGTTSTFSGAGGDSGNLVITTMDWNSDGFVSHQEFTLIFGGAGGDTGASVFVSGQDGANAPAQPASCTCEAIAPPAAVRDEKPKAGDGWVEPGNGADAKAEGRQGKGCGKGQDAIAKGGDGGNIKRIGFDVGGFGLQWGTNVLAGDGGDARANGGPGGPDGGDGGSGTATGGAGGNGGAAPGPAQGGGFGGTAIARGGKGGDAKDCCNPPLPARVPGGNGGTAEATGGKGGDANAYGGDGGSVGATGGDAGTGGDGCGPTLAGHGGTANATVGAAGSGLLDDGNPGNVLWDNDGGGAANGVNCCG